MNLKSKAIGLFAAAIMAVGITAPAFAADQQNVTYQITPGTQFSVTFDSGTNFQAKQFTLGDSSPQYSAAFYYTVVDLRGTGEGWNVKASTPGFFTTGPSPVQVPNVQLRSTNLELYLNDSTPGFQAESGSITTGVTGTSNWTSILAPGGLLMKGTPGINGVTPNATGTFHAGDALYLSFPVAVAAGSYQATIQLTLASGQP